jgi:hypothetical protein
VIPVITEGIQVYVVAVGNKVDRKQVEGIVGPNGDRLFIIPRVNELGPLVNKINDKIITEATRCKLL